MENDNIYFDKQPTRGRPRLVLNEEGKETIEKLASFMCTDEEIATVLGVSIETLQARHNGKAFLECKEKGQNKGKASLRRLQFKAAENGNGTMLIWLGRQWLNQKDRQDVSLDMEKDYTLNIVPASSVVNNPDNGSDGE